MVVMEPLKMFYFYRAQLIRDIGKTRNHDIKNIYSKTESKS